MVDFRFSAEQDALRVAVRMFLADLADAGTIRAMLDDDTVRAEVWSSIIELGWPGLVVPEAQGGLGLGLVDLVVVAEELGSRAFSGPYLSNAIATMAATRLGLDDLLVGIADGASRGTIALEEQGHGDPVARVRARARRSGSRWTLQGHKPIVLDAVGADWVLVAARTEGGIGTFLVDLPSVGAAVEAVPALDVARSVSRLALDDLPATPVGPDGDQTQIWRRIADDAGVVLAAELTGVCDAAFAMAVDYSTTRVQFDVPLSSHQAIQHQLVDMLHVTEMGRVGVHYAAWCSDTDHADREAAASIAKSSMAEAAISVTAANIQVHGAVGFTWDCDAQLFFKRAKQNDLLYGAQGWHRQRVARHVLST